MNNDLIPLTEEELTRAAWGVREPPYMVSSETMLRLIAEVQAYRERDRRMEEVSAALDQMRANAGFP